MTEREGTAADFAAMLGVQPAGEAKRQSNRELVESIHGTEPEADEGLAERQAFAARLFAPKPLPPGLIGQGEQLVPGLPPIEVPPPREPSTPLERVSEPWDE